MRVLILGATGMVGQGVLRECLLDPEISSVLTLGRSSTGQHSPKLREIVQINLFDLSAIEGELTGIDACFFCLGVSAVGMNEAQYTRITHDLTISIAHTLLRLNPSLIFLYVSGMGTDSTEHRSSMWARVKGRTENELLAMPFCRAYMLRPGAIVPLHGIRSRTAFYRVFYTLLKPVLPVLQRVFPKYVTTTQELGRAMIELTAEGTPSRVIENREITRR